MLLGGNTELVVVGVMPDLLHIVPVGHDAALYGVLQVEDISLALGLVTDEGVLLTHARNLYLVLGPSNAMMEGNTALGASSPANPALHMPEPLSHTMDEISSSHMLRVVDDLINKWSTGTEMADLNEIWLLSKRVFAGQ